MKKQVLTAMVMAALSIPGHAATCAAGSVMDYITGGYSCDLGNVHFDGFAVNGNFLLMPPNAFRTTNSLNDMLVTPVVNSGSAGFALSNLNVSFTGDGSNTWVMFTYSATALTNYRITGASAQMGNISYSGGSDYYLETWFKSNEFSLDLFHPVVSDATNFPGIANTLISSGVVAGDSGYSQPASHTFIDGYTTLLATTFQGSGGGGGSVPEPTSLALMGLGLVGLVAGRRRLASGVSLS